MKLTWHQHLKSEEDRKEFIETLKNSKTALDRLKKIVYNIREDRESVRVPDYSKPSWAYYQAHQNGVIEMCDLLIELLDLKEKN